MVQLSTQGSTLVFMMLDGERPIGRVVAPVGEPWVGRGAGTVLLQRARKEVERAKTADTAERCC
jgi:hypothetical protein